MFLRRYGRGAGWLKTEGGGAVGDWDGVEPLSRGGKTICEVIDDDDLVLITGVAVCSMSDNFAYRRGYDIALGRAWSQAVSASEMEAFAD